MTSSTPTTITIQWEEVVCIECNGNITGYSVHVTANEEADRIIAVDDVRETTIIGLSQSTKYTVSVAAVDSAAPGLYSQEIIIETPGMTLT